jgi:hypothetical protein
MGNIVDMYNYDESVKPELDYNSLYKLIDYTSILSTNHKCIDDSINDLFFTNHQMFEFGIEYTSYPLMPILALRFIIGNININLTESIDKYSDKIHIEDDSDKKQIEDDSDKIHIEDDSIIKYLFNIIPSLHFKHDEYNINILTLPKKISSFSFTIKLFNTKLEKVVDYSINNNNINEFMNQIYFEKNSYINKNELRWNKKIKSIEMVNLDKRANFIKKINILRKKTIYYYVNIFKIYLKTFINFNEQLSKNELITLILECVQNYSLGIMIFDYINNSKINKKSCDNFFSDLLKIALMCCVIIFYDDVSDTYYVNTLNYDDILNEYKNILLVNSHILRKRKY